MGFFDNDGILGGMFDFDGDGTLDATEQAMEFMFLDEMTESEENDTDF